MKLATLLAISAAVTGAAPAWADSSASAKLYNLSYELIDLAPDDGIAPGIQFSTAPHSSQAGAMIQQFNGQSMVVNVWDGQNGTSPMAPVSYERSGPEWAGSGSVSGDGTLGGTELRAEGHSITTEGLYTTFSASASILRHPTTWYSATAITLTPHTRVVFSADYETAAKVSFDQLKPRGDYDMAQASAWIEVFDQGDEAMYQHGPQFYQSRAETGEWIGQDGAFWSGGKGRSDKGSLNAQLENLGDDPMAAAVSMGVSVYGESYYAAAVPEPSAWAFALSGLSMVASLTIARRRQSV